MLDAYIYNGKRTPFGRYSGSLSSVRPDDLLGSVIKTIVEENPVNPDDIDDVYVGCGNQGGEDSRCVARHAALSAGLPTTTPGVVFQRNCASGLTAISTAAQSITAGEGDFFIAGGVESMSRAPFVVGKADTAFNRQFNVFDSTIGSRFPNKKIVDQYGDDSMPQTADNLAEEFQITREEADTFALASQNKYEAAEKDGFFADEIDSVTYDGGRKIGEITISDDEHPRRGSTMDGLSRLRELNKGGVTTAGNASGVNDGAVAMTVGSRKLGEQTGMKPIARILASASAGVEPRIMGFGPVPASQKALQRADLELKDMDIIEINEAFAAQVLACLRGFNLDLDDSRVNPNGGAIALGHPLGASGPRIALTAARELHRRGGKYALVSLCVGVGQGAAMIMERCN